MEKLQKCVNFILTVPVFFAASCKCLESPETFVEIPRKLELLNRTIRRL
jgi:hypothetical protein